MLLKDYVQAGWQRGGTVVADAFVLNLLWIICSIPIITLIPSLVALFDVLGTRMPEDDGGVVIRYFRAWRKNAIRSYLVGIPFTALICILGFEVVFYLHEHSVMALFMLALCVGLLLVVLAILAYLPLTLVVANIPSRSVVRLSVGMGMRKFFTSGVSVFILWLMVVVVLVWLNITLFAGIVPLAVWIHIQLIKRDIDVLTSLQH